MIEGSQTLDRGLAVLETIDGVPVGIGVRDLARQMKLGPAIVQRLLNTLQQRGYVEQAEDSRRYRIGHRAILLGQSSRHSDEMTRLAQVELMALAETHGLNGYLGAMREDRAVYLLAIPSRHRVVLRVDAGETLALHSTALGKVLLAASDDQRARELLGSRRLPKLTKQTITDPVKIIASLKAVRERGYATSVEENIPGIVSFGAPVRNDRGAVLAGLSVAFAKGTTDLTESAVVDLVVAAAERVSVHLGCPRALRQSWVAA